MIGRIGFILMTALGLVAPISAGPCEAVAWDRLVSAMVRGNEGVIADLVGQGRLSLRLDGLSQGRYTAQQARQLLGPFFRRTHGRSLSCDACRSSGNRAWAQATYRYKRSNTGRLEEERLLLEWFVENGDGLLSGIRSVSAGSHGSRLRDKKE